MKRFITFLLCSVMIFGIAACGGNTEQTEQPEAAAVEEESPFIAGTYEGTAQGYNGEITAVVTVNDTEIESISFKEHKESIGISDPAFSKLPEGIIEKQTVALDAISGCTSSSEGILEAVKTALLAAGASEAYITKAPAPNAEKEAENLSYEADVIIIGAGGAGMTAAYEVAKAGGSVVVIEKTGAIGGNTIAAGSALNGADEPRQKKQQMNEAEMEKIEAILAMEPHDEWMKKWQDEVAKDIEDYKAAGSTYLYDSTNLHKLQTYIGGDYVANPELVDKFAEEASISAYYLEDLGTVWVEELTAAIGATWSRSHMPTIEAWGPKGASFVLPQATKAQELGAQVKLEHKAEHLIIEDGSVTGVTGTTNEGDTFDAKASKGVIIATGGFGANVEMRQKYNKMWPNLDENVKTTNVASATGDGIELALEAGANLVGMEWIQLITNADKQDFSAAINNIVYVNAEGERYVKEDGRRDEIASATLEQTGAYCYWITDTQEVDERLGGVTYAGLVVDELIDGELMFKADTIEDLAKQLNMDASVLQETLDTYNKAVDSGQDELGRQLFGKKIEKGPFYANYVTAKVHHTMGGVEINTTANVLDANGNTIQGLYAAGEVTGGIHGSNRLGGNAIADVVSFGRIAGQEIMK